MNRDRERVEEAGRCREASVSLMKAAVCLPYSVLSLECLRDAFLVRGHKCATVVTAGSETLPSPGLAFQSGFMRVNFYIILFGGGVWTIHCSAQELFLTSMLRGHS